MKYNQFKFQAKVWLYPGRAAWYFVSVPRATTKDIDKGFADLKRGFGSIKVEATIGNSVWKTSIFPDKKEGMYLLPIKSEIRQAERINEGDNIDILLEIRI